MPDAPAAAPDSSPTPAAAPATPAAAPAGSTAAAPAAPTPEPKAAPPPEPEFEIEIDGKKERWTQAKARAMLQRNVAAGRRFEEAARIQKEHQERLERLKKDPFGVMKELGLDPDEYARKRVLTKWEEANLSEGEKALREAQALKEQVENERKTAAEQTQKARIAEEAERKKQEYGQKFVEALKVSGLPITEKSAWAIQRMVTLELRNLDDGVNADHQVLAEMVREGIADEQGAVIDALEEPAAIIAHVGEKRAEKIAKALAKVRKVATAPKAPEAAPPVPEAAPKKEQPHDPTTGRFTREDLAWMRANR